MKWPAAHTNWKITQNPVYLIKPPWIKINQDYSSLQFNLTEARINVAIVSFYKVELCSERADVLSVFIVVAYTVVLCSVQAMWHWSCKPCALPWQVEPARPGYCASLHHGHHTGGDQDERCSSDQPHYYPYHEGFENSSRYSVVVHGS